MVFVETSYFHHGVTFLALPATLGYELLQLGRFRKQLY